MSKYEQLSPHFNRSEFACQGKNCCGGSAPIHMELIPVLENIRMRLGGSPLTINSAYRCLKHNRAIGSSDGSQHPRGTAVDIATPKDITSMQLTYVIKDVLKLRGIVGGGIGVYDTFVHLDLRTDPAYWDERTSR